jgi:4-hydroxybenzoate polyprenyltransferase
MNRLGKCHALLSTARMPNIPSVMSNVWLGIAVGLSMSQLDHRPLPWALIVSLSAAGTALYVAGNFFNDWMDRTWDASHRPERALPRGLFSPALYLTLTVVLTGLGMLLAATANRECAAVAGLIVLNIIIYTIWHKRSAWAVIPMGLCRALLPMLGFAATGMSIFQSPPIIAMALSLLCYIAGLSLSARHESMAHPPRWVSRVSRSLFALTAALMFGATYQLTQSLGFGVVGLIPYAVWLALGLTLHRKPVPRHVSSLLAGIPLVDAMALLPLALALASGAAPWISPFSLACFAVPPLAFLAALSLQRLAPAT